MATVYEIRYQTEQRPEFWLPGSVVVENSSDLTKGDIISAGIGSGSFTLHLDDKLTRIETAQFTLYALGYHDELSGKLLPKKNAEIFSTIPEKLGAAGLRSTVTKCFDDGLFVVRQAATEPDIDAIDDRQQQLLSLLRCSDHIVSTIATEMGIAESRVKTYKTELFNNLRTRTLSGAITLGYLTGLLVPGQERT